MQKSILRVAILIAGSAILSGCISEDTVCGLLDDQIDEVCNRTAGHINAAPTDDYLGLTGTAQYSGQVTLTALQDGSYSTPSGDGTVTATLGLTADFGTATEAGSITGGSLSAFTGDGATFGGSLAVRAAAIDAGQIGSFIAGVSIDDLTINGNAVTVGSDSHVSGVIASGAAEGDTIRFKDTDTVGTTGLGIYLDLTANDMSFDLGAEEYGIARQ